MQAVASARPRLLSRVRREACRRWPRSRYHGVPLIEPKQNDPALLMPWSTRSAPPARFRDGLARSLGTCLRRSRLRALHPDRRIPRRNPARPHGSWVYWRVPPVYDAFQVPKLSAQRASARTIPAMRTIVEAVQVWTVDVRPICAACSPGAWTASSATGRTWRSTWCAALRSPLLPPLLRRELARVLICEIRSLVS